MLRIEQPIITQEFGLWQVDGFVFGFKPEEAVIETFEILANLADSIVLAEVLSTRNADTGIGDTRSARIYSTVYELRLINVYRGRHEAGDTIELKQPYQVRHYNSGEDRDRRANIRTTPLSVGGSYVLFINDVWINRRILRTGQPHEEWQTSWGVLHSSLYSAYRNAHNVSCVNHGNWVFESVNRQNDIVFTQQDLLRVEGRP